MIFRNYGLALACVGCVALLPASTCLAQEPDVPPKTAAETLSSEQRIQNALRFPVSAQFREQPLEEVVAVLENMADIDILIDTRALDDVGIGTDVPVSCDFGPQKKLLSLRSVLNHILGQFDLTWIVRHETLTITTPEEAENELWLSVFPVSDLIVVTDQEQRSRYDYQALIEVTRAVIAPHTWDEVGGAGTITPIFGALAISQTQQVNDEIGDLLAAIRQLKRNSQDQENQPVPSSIVVDAECNATARAALKTRVTLDLVESPLSDVALFVSDVCKVPILLDQRALDEIGVSSDAPVTARMNDVSLKMALTRTLYPLDLTWRISDEAVIITTLEVSENKLEKRIYPVFDLVGGEDQEPVDLGLDELIDVVVSNIAPESWDEVGGAGTVVPLTHPAALVISQTQDVHEQIDSWLFAKLRRARKHELENSPVAAQPYRPVSTRMVYHLTPPHDAPPVSAERLVTLIPKLLGKDGWQFRDQVLLEHLEGTLIVQHDQATQRRVQRLLSELGISWSGAETGAGGMGGGGMGGGMFRVDTTR